MSHALVADAVVKLEGLSEERAGRVIALIEDLAELEALEDAVDLEEARIALAAGNSEQWPTLKEVEKRLSH